MWIPRHQSGGPLSHIIFEQYPNERQQAEVAAYCVATYGTHHPKKGVPWFLTYEERQPLGPGDSLPKPEPVGVASVSVGGANIGEVSVAGRGEVRNPGT